MRYKPDHRHGLQEEGSSIMPSLPQPTMPAWALLSRLSLYLWERATFGNLSKTVASGPADSMSYVQLQER